MKILKEIPGLEKGILHCVEGDGDLANIFFAAKLAAELRSKYCCSVAYFSTRGTSQNVAAMQADYKNLVGNLYAEDIPAMDIEELESKIAEIIEKKFVRAVIIDCVDGLEVKDFEKGKIAKRNRIKNELSFCAACWKIPVVLFCPAPKKRKSDVQELNPFLSEMLPQMHNLK